MSLTKVEVARFRSIGKFIELSQIKLLEVDTKTTSKVTIIEATNRSMAVLIISRRVLRFHHSLN